MSEQESLEMDDILEKITFYSFDEAKKHIAEEGSVTPFTVVVQGDEMFVEEYPEEDVVTCRKNAEANVKSSSSFSTHYAFCYDGFLMTDNGQLDALIVECAQRDMEKAYTIALLYKKDEDGVNQYADTPAFVNEIESFYDHATVQAVEAREKVEAMGDTEMDDAQEMLKKHLSGESADDVVDNDGGAPAVDGETAADGE